MNGNLPKVSIVLPIYNGARYMSQSIDSCINQTYSNWELIIVDDASTDNTPEKIVQYVAQDSRIRSVRHETNRKLPAALNTGFSQANGEYLTWTSDDNYYRPQALVEMVAFLESHHEVDIVYCDYTEIDIQGHSEKTVSVIKPEDVFKGSFGPCFLYRDVVQKKLGGYSEDLFLCEDYDFWLRASVYFQARSLHKDLYFYREHDASLTRTQSERCLLVRDETLKRNFPRMDWLNNRQRADGYLQTARKYWEYGNNMAACKNLMYAVQHSPGYVFRQPRLLASVLLGRKVVGLLRYARKRLVKT